MSETLSAYTARTETDQQTTPPALLNVHQAMAKAMGAVRAVGKWGQNTEQGYRFRSIDHFMSALNPAMAEAGVHIAPKVLQRIVELGATRTGTVQRMVDLEVQFTFYGPDGSHFDVVTWGEAKDTSDKATNKAQTGAFKYAIMQAFMVPTQDLDDADRHSPEQAAQPQAPTPPTTPVDPELVLFYRSAVVKVVEAGGSATTVQKGLAAIWTDAKADNALGADVRIPVGWRAEGDPEACLLHELISGARGKVGVPSGETEPEPDAEPALDVDGTPTLAPQPAADAGDPWSEQATEDAALAAAQAALGAEPAAPQDMPARCERTNAQGVRCANDAGHRGTHAYTAQEA